MVFDFLKSEQRKAKNIMEMSSDKVSDFWKTEIQRG